MNLFTPAIKDNAGAQAAVRSWIEALRSGAYEQGTEKLARGDHDKRERYCCLGVACNLNRPDAWAYVSISEIDNEWVHDDQETMLAPAEVSWLRLTDECGSLHAPNPFVKEEDWEDGNTALTTLNDTTTYRDAQIYTFKDIADIIEWELEEAIK